MIGFEHMRLAILRLLVRRVNHSITTPSPLIEKKSLEKYKYKLGELVS